MGYLMCQYLDLQKTVFYYLSAKKQNYTIKIYIAERGFQGITYFFLYTKIVTVVEHFMDEGMKKEGIMWKMETQVVRVSQGT